MRGIVRTYVRTIPLLNLGNKRRILKFTILLIEYLLKYM